MLLPVLSAVLAFQQAGTAELPTTAQDRLSQCLKTANADAETAAAAATDWANHALGGEASMAQQCLGFAYMNQSRWPEAETAFIAARDARAPDDKAMRGRLGAMAGNAALANGDDIGAAATLATAQEDATSAGLADLAGTIAADRARALVGAKRDAEAEEVLAGAQVQSPQVGEVWLLSAALARRTGDLAKARELVAKAAALAPKNPEVGLEAGLIAALAGDDATARSTWNAVIALAPDEPNAATARAYLSQLDQDKGTAPQ